MVTLLARPAHNFHQSCELVLGAGLQHCKGTETWNVRCCCRSFAQNIMLQSHQLQLGFDRSKRVATALVCCTACSRLLWWWWVPEVLGSPPWPPPSPAWELGCPWPCSWIWHWWGSWVQLSWGTAWFCLTYWEQGSVHASWGFSPEPASTVPSLCGSARGRSLLYGRRRGEKGDCALLLDGQMQPEERSHIPTAHSQPVGALLAQVMGASQSPVPASGKTPPFQSFRRGNALPALLWFISCFVGAKSQMAAQYNCARNRVFGNGLWLQGWMENPQRAVG